MTEDQRARQFEAARLPLDALCDRLVAGPHAWAHAAVPRIRSRLATLATREPAGAAADVHRTFVDLADRLLAHLAKEENILFPALAALADAERAGASRPPLAFPTILHPIRVLEGEHERLMTGLAAVEALTGGVDGPPVDGAWRAVLDDLATFRSELVAHIAFEADVLFPRALELDRRM
jgi:regulator of cell morphogenesis and NO signaling